MSIFADRLKYLMEMEGTSINALHKGTGIARNSISQYLGGISFPRYDKLTRIANYYEVSVDYLLGYYDNSDAKYISDCAISEIPALFIDRLKQTLKDKDMTDYALSVLLNIEQTTVSKWTRRKTMPEFKYLSQISKVLNVSSDYLLGRKKK